MAAVEREAGGNSRGEGEGEDPPAVRGDAEGEDVIGQGPTGGVVAQEEERKAEHGAGGRGKARSPASESAPRGRGREARPPDEPGSRRRRGDAGEHGEDEQDGGCEIGVVGGGCERGRGRVRRWRVKGWRGARGRDEGHGVAYVSTMLALLTKV